MRPTWIHALILGAFCLGFGVILAYTDLKTEGDITQRIVEDKERSLAQVLPPEIHDNSPVKDTLVVKNHKGENVTIYRAKKDGQVTGVAYEIVGEGGYAGPIKMIMGIDAEGKVLGVRVITHRETPGLGDKIQVNKGDWITRFNGLSVGNPPIEQWKVKKDGGQFDQFAGATITPRAVLRGLREGLTFFAEFKSKLLEAG